MNIANECFIYQIPKYCLKTRLQIIFSATKMEKFQGTPFFTDSEFLRNQTFLRKEYELPLMIHKSKKKKWFLSILFLISGNSARILVDYCYTVVYFRRIIDNRSKS